MTQCEELLDVLASEQCAEDFAGIGSVIYMGLKADLQEPLTESGPTWTGLAFKTGKGLYRIDCKEEANNIEGTSGGMNGGFNQTLKFTVDFLNRDTARLARVINNRQDAFYLVEDGDEIQIMYHPKNKVQIDSGGITSTTGDAADSDRQTTYSVQLKRCKYPNNYLVLGENQTLEGLRVATTP
ncbi:MAG: hypothetical protein IJ557_02495 [Bacteroidaceae bacterium]|nr:hypothetical protein [Bacteroidaceae bacterium]